MNPPQPIRRYGFLEWCYVVACAYIHHQAVSLLSGDSSSASAPTFPIVRMNGGSIFFAALNMPDISQFDEYYDEQEVYGEGNRDDAPEDGRQSGRSSLFAGARNIFGKSPGATLMTFICFLCSLLLMYCAVCDALIEISQPEPVNLSLRHPYLAIPPYGTGKNNVAESDYLDTSTTYGHDSLLILSTSLRDAAVDWQSLNFEVTGITTTEDPPGWGLLLDAIHDLDLAIRTSSRNRQTVLVRLHSVLNR